MRCDSTALTNPLTAECQLVKVAKELGKLGLCQSDRSAVLLFAENTLPYWPMKCSISEDFNYVVQQYPVIRHWFTATWSFDIGTIDLI